jgi:hypothetical protein
MSINNSYPCFVKVPSDLSTDKEATPFCQSWISEFKMLFSNFHGHDVIMPNVLSLQSLLVSVSATGRFVDMYNNQF